MEEGKGKEEWGIGKNFKIVYEVCVKISLVLSILY